MTRDDRIAALKAAAEKRILVFDGAWGTMIQALKLSEEDFRGERFKDHPAPLQGNNDILVLTKQEECRDIARAYLDAGADVVGTNTFNANAISQADYDAQDCVFDMNKAAAEICREAAEAKTAETPDRPRLVAGAIGPTNRTLSLSPDVNRPEYRAVDWDDMYECYKDQARGLLAGGVDFYLVETIFDTLNAKAAIAALLDLNDESGEDLPIAISGTITDKSGRTLSGQTVEAFWNSVRHAKPLTVGLNCALGAAEMKPFIAELSRVADCLVHAYPNAGLPNDMGEYDETPDDTSRHLRAWAEAGYVNFVGGCCGTTPAHIAKIAELVDGVAPRKPPVRATAMRLSGLEPFELAG